MASIVTRPNGHHWIQFKRPDGKRATLRLGKCSRQSAAIYQERIDRLIEYTILQRAIDRHTLDWLKGLHDKTYQKIAAHGLIPERPRQTIGGLIEVFLQAKTGKPRTLNRWNSAGENLKEFFTEDRQLSSITAGDADEFRSFLQTKANRLGKAKGTGLAPQTAQKRLSQAGAIFRFAYRKGWLSENPFAGVTIAHAPPIKDRSHFVDAETTHRLLDACSQDPEFQLLVALARFAGIRHESETSVLEWRWVDWETDQITIRSPKTEHMPGKAWRRIPIFAELRPFLDAAWERAGESPYLLPTIRLVSQTATTNRLRRACRRIGIEMWPKPWVNMRSTRETEIEELFGIKCACDWIGNTEAVAKRHYLQITKERHARAVSDGAGAKRPPEKRSKKRSTKKHE